MSATVGTSLIGGGWVPAWQQHSACLTAPDLPWTGDRTSTAEQQAMATVCAGCPVLGSCTDFAASTKANAGFWAGKHYDLKGASTPLPVAPTTPQKRSSAAVSSGNGVAGGPWVDSPPPGPPTWALPVEQLELDFGPGSAVVGAA